MPRYNSIFSIIQSLQRHGLSAFTSHTLGDLLGLSPPQASRLAGRMETTGLAAQVEHGKYVFLGLEPERVLSNPAFIASHLATPAYVSFWSALHYHGFTEQAPRTTFVAVTRRKAAVEFRGLRFHFVQIAPGQFFGYRRESLGDLPVVVADEAKAIVDSLYRPRYAGGVAEVAKALYNGREALDVPTLVDYANRMGNQSLGSRLGYLLSRLGFESQGLEISPGPVILDPGRPRGGVYQARWRVYANLPQADLVPAGDG